MHVSQNVTHFLTTLKYLNFDQIGFSRGKENTALNICDLHSNLFEFCFFCNLFVGNLLLHCLKNYPGPIQCNDYKQNSVQ